MNSKRNLHDYLIIFYNSSKSKHADFDKQLMYVIPDYKRPRLYPKSLYRRNVLPFLSPNSFTVIKNVFRVRVGEINMRTFADPSVRNRTVER